MIQGLKERHSAIFLDEPSAYIGPGLVFLLNDLTTTIFLLASALFVFFQVSVIHSSRALITFIL
jgi:hypothetical protein